MAGKPIKIAMLTDMSGPYASVCKRNVYAASMAIEGFGGTVLGLPVVYLHRDHHSRTEMANQMAEELYKKEKVDVIFDCPNSAAALVVSHQALKNKKLYFSISSGTTLHTGQKCHRYTFDWGYNDYMIANTSGIWAAQNLGKKWFTITADYAWGYDLLKHFKHALENHGGKLIGNEMVPLGALDFSSYVLKAKKSDPDVVVLLNTGRDSVNANKQAYKFGIKKKVHFVQVLLLIDVIEAAGLKIYANNYASAPWYWEINNPGVPEFVEKWLLKFDSPPNWLNAATYSAVTQYLNAVERAGTKETKAVVEELEGHAFTDLFANPGLIRSEDHMQIGSAHILRVKRPDEVQRPFSYFEILGNIPAEKAYMAPSETGCTLGDF